MTLEGLRWSCWVNRMEASRWGSASLTKPASDQRDLQDSRVSVVDERWMVIFALRDSILSESC